MPAPAYASNYLSGNSGAVLVYTAGTISTATGILFGATQLPFGGYTTTWAFGKWKLALKCETPKISNLSGVTIFNLPSGINTTGTFTLAFQQLQPGMFGATLSLDGPYDQGNMPLMAGYTFTFQLNYTSSLFINTQAIVGQLEPFVDVEGAEMIRVTAESTGFMIPYVK